MSDLPALLLASLNPTTRKQAEQHLSSLSQQAGFFSHMLRLILDKSTDPSVRLSGSVYLKNATKMRWEDDVQPISEQDKTALKAELVPAMLALSGPGDKSVRAQVAESVSLIAELDFPEKWPDLIDQLVASFSPTDYSVNLGVLQTAHSIFRPWRSHVRSDKLYTEINLVLKVFMKPFLHLFRQTANALLTQTSPDYQVIAQNMALLVDIFYDLTCQDLPPDLEDNHEEFFAPDNGWFLRFLPWDPESLRTDPDEATPSLPAQIKTGILEVAELYIKLYPETLQKVPTVPAFVQGVWSLVGSNKLPGLADDGLVSQALRFISTAIRTGYYKDLFGSRDTISNLVQGVVVPNVSLREHDVEQFEDDPLEFIRRDLTVTSSADVATRRHAASDVLQALVSSGFEADTTEIVGQRINAGLQEYSANPSEGWRAKDSAVYLLTAIATRGSTAQHGVTSTNALVDVVKFFSEHVFQDLQAQSGTVHPMLQVDAIRFLYTFRNQLTKPQLLSVLPLLISHLGSQTYVTYTYAAITIDRILAIKQANQMLFNQADIHDYAQKLLDAVLVKVEAAGTAEKMAENEHLMKCAMRVIVTAKQTLTPSYQTTLSRLVAILGVICKNPSNPNFDQYIFESISALMRFVVSGTPATLAHFEQTLFGPFTIIIQQDIDQYIPYVFQILAQMLQFHTQTVPNEFRGLLPFLLTPAVWQQKGSIPGLVRLLKVYLERDTQQMVTQGQITPVLAVVQQRLIPSKLNDAWGFELLQAVVQFVPFATLKETFRAILMTLLTRMQTSKTDKYTYLFSHFLLFTLAVGTNGLDPDFVIGTVEGIQGGLWTQILNNFIIPQVPIMPQKDRKVAAVGLIRMLTQSSLMLNEPSIRAWSPAFTALVKLFKDPQLLTKSAESNASEGLTDIDFEEQTAGYQAAYSRLASSESGPVDPVANVQDPRDLLGNELVKVAAKNAQGLKMLLGACDATVVGPFVQSLQQAGYTI